MSFGTISVIGLGYIGLPTAAMFAESGKTVVGVDVNEETVNTINCGQVHIVEPDLDVVVKRVVEQGLLKATTVPEPADAFLIAVPTPFKGSGHEPDLSYIQGACRAIAPVLKKGDLVVLESTSPVGATEQVSQWLQSERPDLVFPANIGDCPDVYVAHCPERVLPGQVMRELIENDRVIGGVTPRCSERAVQLYRAFVKGECVITNARTAEMAKLTENSFRDVNIAFANELSVICAELDINVWELIGLANRHPRVNILQPGPGVGGHCIAVDPWFIVSKTPELARLINISRVVNDDKPGWVLDKVKEKIDQYLSDNPGKLAQDVTVACYGLAFKANIDDLRESPALSIAESIVASHHGEVLSVEPNVECLPSSCSSLVLADVKDAQKDAHVHVLLVDHVEFQDLYREDTMKYFVDTRGIWVNS